MPLFTLCAFARVVWGSGDLPGGPGLKFWPLDLLGVILEKVLVLSEPVSYF